MYIKNITINPKFFIIGLSQLFSKESVKKASDWKYLYRGALNVLPNLYGTVNTFYWEYLYRGHWMSYRTFMAQWTLFIGSTKLGVVDCLTEPLWHTEHFLLEVLVWGPLNVLPNLYGTVNTFLLEVPSRESYRTFMAHWTLFIGSSCTP